MQLNAMSLKSKIIAQFIIIILPLLMVLTYQLVSNIKSAAGLQRVNLYEHIHEAKVKYTAFVNGVVDAVDSGAVNKNSLSALDEAKISVQNLKKADPRRDFSDLIAQLESVHKSVSADSSIMSLLPLRETINKLDKRLLEIDTAYAEANRQAIAQTVASVELLKLIVSIATFFTLVITVFFVWRMIRGLTEPLKEAEQLANRIAAGEIKSNCEVTHAGDLGNLMTSLCAMNNSLYRTISRIKDVAGTVSKASASMSSSADEVLSAAQRQQDVVSQTRADIEIMNESIRHVSDRTSEAQQGAAKTQEVANTGSSNMAKSLTSTEQIVAAVEATAGKINHLNNSVQKINEFTQIIREIAEQTNLLALNAAIEAARAGEQGRGFAVVADEVRKLAERTSAGTTEIADIVTTVHTQANEAVLSMDKVKEEVAQGAGYSRTTNDILQQIVSSAHESADQSKQNAASAIEQMAAANKAVENTERIAAITDENNTHIQQMHLAADNLNSTATELQQLIGQFKLV